MTNYPQQPNMGANRGMGENPLADPGMRMILSMSPQDGSLRPLPANLSIQESPNGTMKVSYPDGSVRELIPGAQGEGRMITTLADGTRIQSDLTMGNGQVSVASISSTGEKTFLSLNENGANMQKITADGSVSNVIPESAPELIQSFREAEAFAQAEELREQEQFAQSREFGEWNNYGKPADWQPNQGYGQPGTAYGLDPQPEPPHTSMGGNWQQEQVANQAMQAVSKVTDLIGSSLQFGEAQEVQSGEVNFTRPDYAGNSWVDNGTGSWIAPIQPDAFPQPQQYGEWNNYGKPAEWQPQQNWQPPQFDPYGSGIGISQRYDQQEAPRFEPAQEYGQWNNYGKPADWQPEQNWQPPQGNWQPPATFMPPQNFDGGYAQQGNWQPPATFMPPQNFGGAQGIIDTNGYQQPAAFMPPQNFDGGYAQQGNWQPPATFMPPQNFGGAQGIIDTNGYPQPAAFMPPQNFDGGYAQQGNWQPPATFMPPQNFGGAQGIIDTNGYQQPAAFMPPQNFDGGYAQQGNWQPPATFMPPQNFGGAQGIIDTNGYPQPAAFMPPQNFDGGYAQQGNWQPPATFMPPQNFGGAQGIIDTNGFPPPPFKDFSGFPVANAFQDTSAPNFSGGESVTADFSSTNEVEAPPFDNPDQQSQQ